MKWRGLYTTMGLVSKAGGLCAGAIAVAGSVALWNALLSLLAKRRYAI